MILQSSLNFWLNRFINIVIEANMTKSHEFEFYSYPFKDVGFSGFGELREIKREEGF